MALLCNDVSHWLGASQESVLWCLYVETIFALLILYEGNPLVTKGFPSQRVDLWCFFLVSLKNYLNKSWVARDLRSHDIHVMSLSCFSKLLLALSIYLWLMQDCVSNGDTAVLHWAVVSFEYDVGLFSVYWSQFMRSTVSANKKRL